MTNKFRILSIDGGGIKGIFPASFLTNIEKTTGKRLMDYFDLMVGTSTGGIIVLALSIGIPASEVLHLYLTKGKDIFPSGGWGSGVVRSLRSVFRPKYDASPLVSALKATFGEHRLGEAKCRVCVPSYNATVNDVWIYKTAHHERLKNDYKLPLVDIARATTAAPTFFSPSVAKSGAMHIDGGMWVNNPAMLAYVEAVAVLGVDPTKVRMLSLGTTDEASDWGPTARKGGLASWASSAAVVKLLMYGQSKAADNQVRLLLGNDRYFRVNPQVPASKYALDNVHTAADLAAYGEREARHLLPKIERLFFDKVKESFEPVYTLR